MKLRNIFNLFISIIFLFGLPAYAGVFEVGATANYRTSKIDPNNYSDSTSYTGSFSYYFMEMSALELSYTKGVSNLFIKAGTDPSVQYQTTYEMLGADLVFSFADRQDPIQPYVKIGIAKVIKEILKQQEGGALGTQSVGKVDSTVPSAGLGFKLGVTKTFYVKFGIDAWQTESSAGDKTVDLAGRAGISWYL